MSLRDLALLDSRYPKWVSGLYDAIGVQPILQLALQKIVGFIRRYWAIAVLLSIVAVHAVVIGYIRGQVADLARHEATSIKVGDFRFQNGSQLDTIYRFELHAILDPERIYTGRRELTSMSTEIREACEQMLRQANPDWLQDPTQKALRRRLAEVIRQHLNEPTVERVLIVDWLQLPAGVKPLAALPTDENENA